MRVPEVLTSLVDQGVIDEVIRPLKSGKEAQVYLVRSEGETRVAKVYKESLHRSFKQRALYTEGRRVRNTRDQRAIQRRTRHGKAQEEEAWKSTEVNVIFQLHASGVRVPTPYNFIDGVLIMELVRGEDGNPAPRLGELTLGAEVGRAYFDQLLGEVVKMLCAGYVHGDLSDYNVLVDEHGPVVIDFPQAVDASSNRNAKKLLIRDVDNLSAFLHRCMPSAKQKPYGQEIWAAFEKNTLTPEMQLTGAFKRSTKETNMAALLDDIEDANEDERRRRGVQSPEAVPRTRRREVVLEPPRKQSTGKGGRGKSESGSGGRGKGGSGSRSKSGRGSAGRSQSPRDAEQHRKPQDAPASGESPPKKRRRRRRRGGAASGTPQKESQARPVDRLTDNKVDKAAASDAAPPKKRRRRRRRGPRSRPAAPGNEPQKPE